MTIRFMSPGSLPLIWGVFLASAAQAQSTAVLPEPQEFPNCDLPAPVLFAQVTNLAQQPVGLENLDFDGEGNLWLTALGDGLFHATPDGKVRLIARSDRGPGNLTMVNSVENEFMGVVRGPDGALYVSEGRSVAVPINARVLRFPKAGEPEFEVLAEGFDGVNGIAADLEGNIYVAHGFRNELWKITPDGASAVWTRVPDIVNGLSLHPGGQHLVIAPIADTANSVFAIPLDEPEARELLFQFNIGPSLRNPSIDPSRPVHLKGIDDLAVAPDDRVLISAHLRDQFLLGDPTTGEACILLDNVNGAASSIRVARGFGPWNGWAFATTFAGEVWAFDIGTTEQLSAVTRTDPVSTRPAAGATGWLLLLFGIGRLWRFHRTPEPRKYRAI